MFCNMNIQCSLHVKNQMLPEVWLRIWCSGRMDLVTSKTTKHKQIKNWDSPGHQVNKIVTRILTFRSDESEIKTLTNTPPHPPFPKHPFCSAHFCVSTPDVVPFHYWCQSGIWLTCVQYNTSTVCSKIESWIKSSTTFWCQISSINYYCLQWKVCKFTEEEIKRKEIVSQNCTQH